jgi:hypothetical protein
MDMLLGIGRIAGIVGLLVCLVAVGVRLGGSYLLGGFPVVTLFTGGIAAMVAGCFCLLWVMTTRR